MKKGGGGLEEVKHKETRRENRCGGGIQDTEKEGRTKDKGAT